MKRMRSTGKWMAGVLLMLVMLTVCTGALATSDWQAETEPPKTGDTMPLIGAEVLLLASGTTCVVLAAKNHREKKNGKDKQSSKDA